jgi:glutamate formiminotransferase
MLPLIECIPNFSEGRDKDTIDALADTARSVPGAALLDYSSDESHNRSVLTLAGSPEGIAEAAFRLAAKAVGLIDLTKHRGEHPRMGAVDVIPFVPLNNAQMSDCIAISRQVAERISRELNVPTYLYAESAAADNRRNLAHIRRGGFEGLAKRMRRPEWHPDFGPASPHPTAGAVAVGARGPLVAFNVNLNTSDIKVADAVAKAVRGSNGGLAYCKAIGVQLSKDVAQVSMNMVNYELTPLYRAFELVKTEAARYGVTVKGSELIGLCPAKAFIDSAAYYLQLENYNYERQVLEQRLENVTCLSRPASMKPSDL